MPSIIGWYNAADILLWEMANKYLSVMVKYADVNKILINNIIILNINIIKK